MKFLKYFESSEDDLGFDIDELKYYFTDLEDIGCTVRLRTSTKLIQSKSSDLTHFDFNMVIFIKVYIMPTRENQLRIFMMSDLFNEVINFLSVPVSLSVFLPYLCKPTSYYLPPISLGHT